MATHNVQLTASYIYKPSRLCLQRILLWACSAALGHGDRLKIDPERLVTTLNGVNIRGQVTGGFPFLEPGQQAIEYNDSEGSRELELRALWRGRWG